MKVQFSADGTRDADFDDLSYAWEVATQEGTDSRKFNEANPVVSFDKAGVYKATLTVTDSKGESSSQSLEILAGNEEPVLVFETPQSNQTFFFPNQPFDYEVKVNDKEDGSLESGTIKPEEVAINFDYLPEGYDLIAIAQGHRSADEAAGSLKGLRLIEGSDCKACHAADKKSVGPSYAQIAEKYKNDSQAGGNLAKKIISGGSGVWGEVAMSAHPQVSEADALEMATYILSSGAAKEAKISLPVKGSYVMSIPDGDKGEGIYVVRAAYQDKGNQGIPSISSEKILTLRNAKMPAGKAEIVENSMKYGTVVIASVHGAYIGFKNLDLTGIETIAFTASAPQSQLNAAGGTIEVRLGSASGKLIGSAQVNRSSDGQASIMPPPITAKIEDVAGFHDVFFVFTNEQAASGQSLFVVAELEFQTEAYAASKANSATSINEKQLSQEDIRGYVGKYKFTGLPFEFIEISTSGGKLYFQAGETLGILRATQQDNRFEGDGGMVIEFGRGASNQVENLTMKASGFEFKGKKQ
jgi:cytochrome c